MLELLRAGRGAERILIATELSASRTISEIRKRAQDAGIPVKVVPRTEVDRAADGLNHQGVVAFAGRYRYTPLEEILARDAPAIAVLDGVMDPHNLGSILRSADGAGIDGVVIRSQRAVGVTPAVRRVAAGAAEVVPVARVNNITQALGLARRAGLWVVGLDEKAGDDVWSSGLLERPVALVLGSEDKGISKSVAETCDGFARIPSKGRIDSLNVGVAAALAMFEIARRGDSSDNV